MADYTSTKTGQGTVTPDGAIATPWGRLEPLIKPEQIRTLHLLGIPLLVRDQYTRKTVPITDTMLKEYIQRAVNEAELETSLTIMPTQHSEKLPYNRQDYDSFGYLKLSHHPVSSIESLTIQLADKGTIFGFPLEWVETANLVYGQINLIPMAYQTLTAGQFTGNGLVGFGGNSVFFNNLWNRDWVPALLNVTYTAGWPNGDVPSYVNELIGIIAATRVLSLLAATQAKITGQSLSADGLSQSISGPGAQVYLQRLQDLDKQRQLIVKRLRAAFQSNFVITAI